MPKLWRPVKHAGYYDREIKYVLLHALHCDDREVLNYLEQVIKQKQLDLLLWKDDLPTAFHLLTHGGAYYAAEFVAKYIPDQIQVNRNLQYIIAEEEREFEEADLYSDAQTITYSNHTLAYCDCDGRWSYYTGCWTSSMMVFDDWFGGWHGTGYNNGYASHLEEHAEWSSYRPVAQLLFDFSTINAINELQNNGVVYPKVGTVSVEYCKQPNLRPLPTRCL
jgi:hypothetical protein